MCVSVARPKESDNMAFRAAAMQDSPYGLSRVPFVYEPANIKTGAVPWIVFLLLFAIACLTIQLRFNELNIHHITRTWGGHHRSTSGHTLARACSWSSLHPTHRTASLSRIRQKALETRFYLLLHLPASRSISIKTASNGRPISTVVISHSPHAGMLLPAFL